MSIQLATSSTALCRNRLPLQVCLKRLPVSISLPACHCTDFTPSTSSGPSTSYTHPLPLCLMFPPEATYGNRSLSGEYGARCAAPSLSAVTFRSRCSSCGLSLCGLYPHCVATPQLHLCVSTRGQVGTHATAFEYCVPALPSEIRFTLPQPRRSRPLLIFL